jgi:hypothetical protein
MNILNSSAIEVLAHLGRANRRDVNVSIAGVGLLPGARSKADLQAWGDRR